LQVSKARSYIDRGLEWARQLQVQVSLALVDEFGQLVQLDRMDGAPLMSPDIAEAKAVTALNFKSPTRKVADVFKTNPEIGQALQQTVHFKIMPIAGGVVIWEGDRLIGAIGVSGASGDQEEEIANQAVS